MKSLSSSISRAGCRQLDGTCRQLTAPGRHLPAPADSLQAAACTRPAACRGVPAACLPGSCPLPASQGGGYSNGHTPTPQGDAGALEELQRRRLLSPALEGAAPEPPFCGWAGGEFNCSGIFCGCLSSLQPPGPSDPLPREARVRFGGEKLRATVEALSRAESTPLSRGGETDDQSGDVR